MEQILADLEEADELGDPWEGVDAKAVRHAARQQAECPVPGVEDMESYLAAQVSDTSHRDVIGPLLDGQGASGVIVRRGTVIASWGQPTRAEMAYSATKSVLSLVAGIAHDDGMLLLDQAVSAQIDVPQFATARPYATPRSTVMENGAVAFTVPVNISPSL
ncbi:hypothetical protein H3146_13245 [Streptomyces sp. OF3]|uniref:Serine hydrolase n=1 Tax=Streptomyces alkaliterrae TaxID=2213162 RepID=A0A7W3ZMV5_9ACTN|nr:hypothetical protein [Streptomyces alkaliterrae]MBB1254319.1 hypothetical protein [Streptomyces alkaliterrae]